MNEKYVETAMRSIILQKPNLVDIPDKYGINPLHLVLLEEYKSLQAINLLLDNGANVRYPDHRGKTGLHHLAGNIQRNEYKDMFQRFLDLGADINSRNNKGETPLFRYIAHAHFASDTRVEGLQSTGPAEMLDSGHTEPCFDFFRENGADFFTRNKGGSSLLHLLASF